MTIASFLIEVSLNLDDTLFPSVLAHEFMHLKLLQISQDAGSPSELGRSNPGLSGIINLCYADKEQNPSWLNDAHHFYMGQHIEEMEQLLRIAFPGMEEEFYEYGKWGGGAFNSEAFRQLPAEGQDAIWDYLEKLGLL